MKNLKKIGSIVGKIFVVLFVLVVIIVLALTIKRWDAATAIIYMHDTRITIEDVMGEALPPKRTKEEYDRTVLGLDENENGIRDDVEHAIFEMTDDSLAMRAAKLQYAQTAQFIYTSVINGETMQVYLNERGEARNCIYDIMEKEEYDGMKFTITDPLEALIHNTPERKTEREKHAWYETTIVHERVYPETDGGCHITIDDE